VWRLVRVFVNFSNRSIHMKVSLVALVAGCAVASSAFGGVDMPPIVPRTPEYWICANRAAACPSTGYAADRAAACPSNGYAADRAPACPSNGYAGDRAPHARVMDMPPIVPRTPHNSGSKVCIVEELRLLPRCIRVLCRVRGAAHSLREDWVWTCGATLAMDSRLSQPMSAHEPYELLAPPR